MFPEISQFLPQYSDWNSFAFNTQWRLRMSGRISQQFFKVRSFGRRCLTKTTTCRRRHRIRRRCPRSRNRALLSSRVEEEESHGRIFIKWGLSLSEWRETRGAWRVWRIFQNRFQSRGGQQTDATSTSFSGRENGAAGEKFHSWAEEEREREIAALPTIIQI